ncbi:MAG: DUF4214 domain-containing protein, partial [Clostridiales bacterium]|nr:DUF4214 domain-containing protein [Clostridiales bacterium]
AMPVFAKDVKEIVLDDKSHFECDCDKNSNEFLLKIDKDSAVFFAVKGTESIEYTITDLDLNKAVETQDYYNVTNGNQKYAEMKKGTYKITVDCSSTCKLTVDINEGYLLVEHDGKKDIYDPYLNAPQNLFIDGDSAKISFVNPKGQKITSDFYDLNGTYEGPVELKVGEWMGFSIAFKIFRISLNFNLWKNVETEFTCEPIRCTLLEEGAELKTSFPYTSSLSSDQVWTQIDYYGGPAGEHIIGGASYDYTYPSISGPSCLDAELHVYDVKNDIYHSNTKYAELHIYLKDKSGENKLVPNTETAVHLEKLTKEKEQQLVYAFTPEKDGYCTITSSGEGSDPMIAVFDSSDNNIGWYRDNINLMDWLSREYTLRCYIDHQLNLKTELKGGQTYYFYLTNSGKNPDFTIKMTYEEKKEDPPTQAPTTDTPATGAPTTVAPSNDEMSFDDFVERLYVVALNRQSEKEGKDYWCELVGNGTLTGADCARFFLTSPEFKGRGLSDEDFLKVLYKTFFDRDAVNDPDGFSFWMNSLKSVGKDTVVEGFINSPEWCNICATYGVKSGAPTAKATIASKNATAFATRLYTECLGREPEEGGLKYWSLGLTNLELTGSQAAHEFFYSKEFNDHNFDNKELLTRMYRTFMGREPDTDGLNYWLDCMSKGMTKDQVFNSFVQSQEFTEICASYAIDR